VKVIEEKNNIRVLLSSSEDGLAVYTVSFHGEEKMQTENREEALSLFRQLQPQRVRCDRCGEVDIASFPAKLGIGRIRVAGDGWLMERLYNSEDVTLCPECLKKGV